MARDRYDLVIRNGTVVDGTGLPSYRSDVGVRAGRIARVGRISGTGDTEIDAEGHAVTPGFIDGHTHMDAQVFWDPLGTSSCWHGVTTAVMGHTGFTLAPAEPGRRNLVVANLERAEDMSPAALAAGIDWSWTTFSEYLDAVERQDKAINYVANVGHSALRTFVMGEEAFDREATADETAAMAAELGSALAAGAAGLSTSRTVNHETSDNRPVASRLASWDEVAALVAEVGRAGGGVFQMSEDRASEPAEQDARERRLIDLANATGVTIAVGASAGGRVLDLLDAAAAAGAHIVGLTHSRGIATLSSFASRLPFDSLPEWKALRAEPRERQRELLADPDVRKRLVWTAHHGAYARAIGAEARRPEFDRMVVLQRPVPPNPTVAEVAQARGVDPVEAMIDLALESDFSQFFMQTIAPFDHDAVRKALAHPSTVMTFSDAGAHVSQISDCSIHTHLLAHWVRQLGEFTLEEAVRMMTLAPARTWNLADRGLVREGMVADLNVLDPATVAPAMPELVFDLPAASARIVQRAEGFLATVVAGEVVQSNGRATGALPGRLLRSHRG